MTPKIIHRMWLDKNIPDNAEPPLRYQKFLDTFNQLNPEFEVVFWNMDRVQRLFQQYPLQIKMYEGTWLSLPHHIQKCDMARYLILYIFGGLYIDLDFVCFRNLSPLLNRELLLVAEPPEHSEIWQDPKIKSRLYNGFIGSVAGHEFWTDWLNFIMESLKKSSDVMYTTGPVNFRLFFDQSKYKNTELLNTCDILPIYIDDGKHFITKACLDRNHNKNTFDDDYYKHFENYTHTKWSEGSGWGKEDQFEAVQKEHRVPYLILIIIAVIFIILLVGALIIFIK